MRKKILIEFIYYKFEFLLFIITHNIIIFIKKKLNSFSSSHLVMDGHMSRVFAVKFIPDEDFIFTSAGWDDTVQVK